MYLTLSFLPFQACWQPRTATTLTSTCPPPCPPSSLWTCQTPHAPSRMTMSVPLDTLTLVMLRILTTVISHPLWCVLQLILVTWTLLAWMTRYLMITTTVVALLRQMTPFVSSLTWIIVHLPPSLPPALPLHLAFLHLQYGNQSTPRTPTLPLRNGTRATAPPRHVRGHYAVCPSTQDLLCGLYVYGCTVARSGPTWKLPRRPTLPRPPTPCPSFIDHGSPLTRSALARFRSSASPCHPASLPCSGGESTMPRRSLSAVPHPRQHWPHSLPVPPPTAPSQAAPHDCPPSDWYATAPPLWCHGEWHEAGLVQWHQDYTGCIMDQQD